MVEGCKHACSVGVHLAIFCEENSTCSFQRVLAGSTRRDSSMSRGPVSFSSRERYPWRILLCVTEYLQGQVFDFLSAL